MINKIIYVKYWQGCNNKCSFCNQRLGTKVNDFGKFIYPSKESLIIHTDLLLNEYNKRKDEDIHVFLMGGELFYNTNDKSLYEGFDYLAKRLSEIKSLSWRVKYYSNLLFEDLSLFNFFVNKLNEYGASKKIVQFKTSFDLMGRFKNNSQIDLFSKNLIDVNKKDIYTQIKSLITKETLIKFNTELYTFKTLKKILDVPKAWCLERFKDEHVDDIEIIDHFRVEENLDNLSEIEKKNFNIIENTFKQSKSFLYISYQKTKDQKFNDITFIINNNVKNNVKALR